MTIFISPLPIDRNGRAIQGGSIPHVFTSTMNGTYKEIVIPANQECKSVLLKMQDGSEFNYSHTGTATVPYIPMSSLSIDVVLGEGDSLGYVNGTNGVNLAVLLIK